MGVLLQPDWPSALSSKCEAVTDHFGIFSGVDSMCADLGIKGDRTRITFTSSSCGERISILQFSRIRPYLILIGVSIK